MGVGAGEGAEGGEDGAVFAEDEAGDFEAASKLAT